MTYEQQAALLSAALRSDTLYGDVLRVLIRRLRYPEAPYTSHQLQMLLLLTLAEMQP